jgi:hypothetical protein
MARERHDPKAAHLRVRLASSLLGRLEQAARRNERSMNAEIVERLEGSFAKDEIDTVIKKTAEAAFQVHLRQARVLMNQITALKRKSEKEGRS